jgi:hypothetical protein
MLSEMSPAELAEVIKECEDQLAANARVVQSNHSLQITEDKQLAGVTGEYLRRDVSACFG